MTLLKRIQMEKNYI